ncbi:density-regulated protein homolog [Sycon ciliatum]|uniref:density-regulated protein homolog n=1 Tax=Sycon ciliatum TaxID=27933 RepID=UPI0020AAE84C|eukprot:scpid87207/ scgid12461/ Density-regulated protein
MATAAEDPELEGEEVESGEDEAASVSYPLTVPYCGICTLPIEYCEFTADYEKCKEWWKVNEPDSYTRVIEQGAADLSLDAGGKKGRQTRGGKALKKTKKKEVEKRVTVARASRGKRKYVTIIAGLTSLEIDLKKAAKMFGSRFASGSSVTGPDEITIQGDVNYDLIDFVQEKWPEITDDVIEDIGDQKISKR